MTEPRNRRVARYDLVTPMIPCRDEILAGVEKLLDTGGYILGEHVDALEREMAAATECAAGIGVASGSAALYLALQLAGIGPGVEVITTPYTFIATIEAVIRLGGTPVFVDIDPTDLNLDPGLLEAAITERTKAILPVHIFGMPCRMDEIQTFAERHGLDVIEDMCQAFGSLYQGHPCGSFGRMSCISFYPTKNLPGIGDGGMVLCRDEADAELIRKLRGHQAVRIDGRLHAGWNSRIDEIQAMAIRVRLARFGDEQADRDHAAAIYNGLIPESHRLPVPKPGNGLRVTHHQYWIRTADRGTLTEQLKAEGIDYGVYYDPPLHLDQLGELCRVSGTLDEAERAGREVMALPIHQALPEADAVRIGTIVRKHIEG